MKNDIVEIEVYKLAGLFAENKDIAQEQREGVILPALDSGKDVVLDFKNVEGATQSFVHALISDVIRNYGPIALDRVVFKNCNETIKRIVSIVVDYMQES